MSFLKKRIILKNSTNELNSGLAVLTIQQNETGCFGDVKVYNLKDLNDLQIGISCNGKGILNTKLLLNKENVFNFKLSNFDINGNISGVIVKKHNDNVKALVWGSNNINTSKDELINLMEENTRPKVKFSSVEVYENKPEVKVEEEKSNKLSMSEMFESSDEEVEQIIDEELSGDFYMLIKEQLDELFEKFPSYENLSDLIPDSKWVKVDYEGTGKEYVVGLIYDGGKVKYICYGVPAKFNTNLPEDLEDFSQWLPLDESEPEEDGFYLMFQDALTGDSVQLYNKVV